MPKNFLCLWEAFSAAGADAQVALEVGKRGAAERGRAGDLAFGDAIAVAQVHGLEIELANTNDSQYYCAQGSDRTQGKRHLKDPTEQLEGRPIDPGSPQRRRCWPKRVVQSSSLLGPNDEVVIRHNGRDYRLRRTRLDKLILTA